MKEFERLKELEESNLRLVAEVNLLLSQVKKTKDEPSGTVSYCLSYYASLVKALSGISFSVLEQKTSVANTFTLPELYLWRFILSSH